MVVQLLQSGVQRGALPEPVGPVTRKMPCGLCNSWRNCTGQLLAKPRRSSVRRAGFVQQSQHTTRSPQAEGMVETRINRPTAQQQRNTSILRYALAISSRAITLIRDTSSEASLRPGRSISCNVPSTRNGSPDSFKRLDVDIRSAFFNRSASMALISLMTAHRRHFPADLPFPAVLLRG